MGVGTIVLSPGSPNSSDSLMALTSPGHFLPDEQGLVGSSIAHGGSTLEMKADFGPGWNA